jgi:hypothetical protein
MARINLKKTTTENVSKPSDGYAKIFINGNHELVIKDHNGVDHVFEPKTYTVSCGISPGGVGNGVTGAGNYKAGAAVELNASPGEGQLFTSFSDVEGNILSEANPYVFTMPSQNVTLVANFEEDV